MRPELIIFDCDGVLVDSEPIACRVDAECLAEIGIDISVPEIATRYIGVSAADMFADLECRFNRKLPADFGQVLEKRIALAFQNELSAIPGVQSFIRGVDCKICVASGSRPDRIRRSLELSGLSDHFGSNVFSATQVARGKPAPDVFLFAAGRMQVPPSSCVVIEDSITGVTAATSAGMPAVGFTGGKHCGPGHADLLRKAGATAICADITSLAAIIDAI